MMRSSTELTHHPICASARRQCMLSLFSHALVTARALREAQSTKHSGRSSWGRIAGTTTAGCQYDASQH
eukprot:3164942-Pyramimonas_sp.AAC.1